MLNGCKSLPAADTLVRWLKHNCGSVIPGNTYNIWLYLTIFAHNVYNLAPR